MTILNTKSTIFRDKTKILRNLQVFSVLFLEGGHRGHQGGRAGGGCEKGAQNLLRSLKTNLDENTIFIACQTYFLYLSYFFS